MQFVKAFGGVLPAIVVFAHGSAAVAAVPPVPSAQQVEALCPGLGGNPLAFGTAEGNVTEAALAQAKELAVAAGFEKAQLQYTSWSHKLYGVEYVLDVPGGDDLSDWGDLFGERIMERGWDFSEDPFTPLSAGRYEKEIDVDDGQWVLGVELGLHSTHRGITLLCADAKLQLEDKNERDGELAPGTQRPKPPSPKKVQAAKDYVARFDCDNAEFVAALSAAEELDDNGPIVEALLGPVVDLEPESSYQSRLGTWMRWTMRHSGKITEEEIWAIEDVVAQNIGWNPAEQFTEFLGSFVDVVSAQEAGDGAGKCRGLRTMFLSDRDGSSNEGRRNAAVNAALEAEARRRGIAID